MTAYHHSVYCDLIHNEDATNQNNEWRISRAGSLNTPHSPPQITY
jgi:hypothetical protein